MWKFLAAAAGLTALTISCAFAEPAEVDPPCHGTALNGTVRDSTLALIPGATLKIDGVTPVVSGSDGKFHFGCVPDGAHTLDVTAEGFSTRELSIRIPRATMVDVVLQPGGVETQVDVSAEETPANDANSSGPTQTISGSRLQSLADDPDDLLRELQQLAAASGGNPANATIAVDGFQGSSALPPKSSIAYIKVNPDQFAAEYREPPFDGGRVEVYTKPGQKTFHGALFLTNGSPWENARDPFSTAGESLGKQRYGFELSGPVLKKGSDFALTLEHRSIDNDAVVNAYTLNSTGQTIYTSDTVAAPQRLWLGTARVDWQLGPKNTFITSYSANVNHLANVGVGGSTLPEAGYDAGKYEHMLRFSDVTTASAHLMHEARLSLRWDGQTDVPQSTAPQVQVAGAFTGGGASIGQQRIHELNVEFDDDAIWTTRKHTMKFGTQMMLYNEHQQLTTNFNGTYTFGGGTAPVLDANNQPTRQTTTITGIEQYRRSLLGLAGGTPTDFSNVTGNPAVAFTQVQNALFFEDDWNVGHNVKVSYGVRYFIANAPLRTDGGTPRLGILWSPNKKGTWTLHAHAGMFTGNLGPSNAAEVMREDGVNRITRTVYNPVYGSPFTNATPIYSMREFAPHMSTTLWNAENIGGTRSLPQGWNLSADYYIGRIWNDVRTRNINAPLNGSPFGPRPGAADLNVLQTQNSGEGSLSATFLGVENHSYKRVQFFFGGVRVEITDDTDDNPFFTPQNSYSNAGEFAHRSNQGTWQIFGNSTFNLPGKVQLSTDFNGSGDQHYNITTGFDNNGDGDFNDRPQYAAPGQAGAIQTPFGLLIASGGTGVLPRNQGVMPWTIYLDANLQRQFKLTRNAKSEHQQTLTLNVRSSNVLNHLNVTSVGGVLGSPLFGQAYAADNGRRVELGARYAF